MAGAGQRGFGLQLPDEFTAESGMGIEAIGGGINVLVGNTILMESHGVVINEGEADIFCLQNEAKTVVLIAVDWILQGIIGIAVPVKDTSRETLGKLFEMKLRIAMISGDNQLTASRIAKLVGIDTILAEVLPGEKASEVK